MEFSGEAAAHNRDRYESAFGKNNVRLQLFKNFTGFGKSLEYGNGSEKFFRSKIPPEFAGSDAVIRNVVICHQAFFHSVIGTDIKYLVAGFFELGKKGNIRGIMTGCSSTGKYDFLLMMGSPQNYFLS